VGAEQSEFLLDWNHGAQFSLLASWVRVVAQTYAPNPTLSYEASQGSLQISAAIAEGAAFSRRPRSPKVSCSRTTARPCCSPRISRKGVLCLASNVAPATLADLQATMLTAGSLDMGEVLFSEFREYLSTGVALPGVCASICSFRISTTAAASS